MRPHVRSGLPLRVAGLNLHRARPALAASSRRREPDGRSTLLSSTLPSTSIRKSIRTVPVSFARRAAGGYGGSPQLFSSAPPPPRSSPAGSAVLPAVLAAAPTAPCALTPPDALPV